MAATSSPGKRLLRSKSGLRVVPISECDRSPFELKEPEWIPDKQSPTCMDCKEKFDFLKRRHHCRRCGRVCCAACCDTRMELPRMCFLDPVRLCSSCANTTEREKLFFSQDIKNLVRGAILCLGGDTSNLTHCRLTPDHRFLVLSGDPSSDDSPTCIPLHRLTSLQVERRSQQETCGGCFVTGLVVQYCLAGEEMQDITLEAPQDATANAYSFLTALEKAVFMMQESRDVIGTGE